MIFSTLTSNRKRIAQTLINSIRPITEHSHTDMFTSRSSMNPSLNMINSSFSSRHSTTKLPGFNNSSTSSLYSSDKLSIKPFLVFNSSSNWLSTNSPMIDIRILSRRMITPNNHILNISRLHSFFKC